MIKELEVVTDSCGGKNDLNVLSVLQLAENEANPWWLRMIEKLKIYPKTIECKLKASMYIIGPVLGLVSKQKKQVFLGTWM